jgi:phosphatidylglycerol---prolipoprotein diacylglyceryl transferase
MESLFIRWNVNPEIFRTDGFVMRYYSLLFLIAFGLGYLLLSKIYRKENVQAFLLNKLIIYVFAGTLIGARLGHTLFYEYGYYKNHILEIILPFTFRNGQFELTGYHGLASHGGAIGILIALFLYCRKYEQNFLWVADRLVIVVALGGFFIRLGNLFNSEIIGKPTTVAWAFIFARVDLIPRHPSQLYEAIVYLVIFFLLWMIYTTNSSQLKKGFLFGLFLVLVFTARFLIEFTKENQEAFEKSLPINMGQILSIPFVLIGVYFLVRNKNKAIILKV